MENLLLWEIFEGCFLVGVIVVVDVEGGYLVFGKV